ncbi:23S rRNA (adenine(2503)-C(2))-methyltransferase RlmN [Kiritimatiella glycovorans]|uniref:Probable dual-specificity RNA methyltransferase RlmN n=1 Tax=Kiritimatiella glycovorans TaxID=1307763 RepID=A0A0G3EJN5_9BACT|nr:23S rRNA (adenine(2503)-C(2))-methyltransferase RlmN [Kiritimatiella glycovorans]AKJ65005.1 putative dual-specificity RNA methyltransferase RlmN [Kiritimatiella glycovorans]
MKPLIHNYSRDELATLCEEMGEPGFRAKQLWNWLYVHRAGSWDAMANLPQALRRRLADRLELQAFAEVEVHGEAGDTRKLVADLRDGHRIESVLIPARGRMTLCLSSQVGCRFACAFCASGRAGFIRDLEPGEIIAQWRTAERISEDGSAERKVTHVVYMGVGEPLDNLEAVLKSARILNHPDGANIGARRITFSTCGVIPGIERLAREPEQFELSVSLHAPEDELRSRLMPANRRWPLDALLTTCADYTGRTGRIVTFEYTLIAGVNDTPAHARELARRLSRFPSRVNLIPLSPVEEYEGCAPDPKQAERFIRELDRAGVHATLRRSRGVHHGAACGQLRARAQH